MTTIAQGLFERGWTLRSGGADGADKAFEAGSGRSEIYRPEGDLTAAMAIFEEEVRPRAKCKSIYAMQPYIGKLLARNMHQILGADLQTPSRFVLCWTPTLDYTDFAAGGTRYALLLAHSRGIKILNFLTGIPGSIDPHHKRGTGS